MEVIYRLKDKDTTAKEKNEGMTKTFAGNINFETKVSTILDFF